MKKFLYVFAIATCLVFAASSTIVEKSTPVIGVDEVFVASSNHP